MVQWVFEAAKRSGAETVLVATDDERIADAVRAFDGEAIMTSPHHASGTDRICEVAKALAWSDDTIVVNAQGDEPGMPPAWIGRVAQELDNDPRAQVATLATRVLEWEELFNPNVVKVVLDHDGLARYFSRAPIPWVRGELAWSSGDSNPALPQHVTFLRHLGLYAYRLGTLAHLHARPVSPLEAAEQLEQLRALDLGFAIRVAVVEPSRVPGVDTAEDLAVARRLLAEGPVRDL